ncbi:MAG: hypothetical protein M3545_08755 [Acidobacteriota bacterium]|nr:hypothetical protein [Acidobacteriota bacterium]
MEVDVLLKRVERTAVVVCALMAVVALALTRGRILPAGAVLCGGALALVSYRLIVTGAGRMADTMAPRATDVAPPAERVAPARVAHPAVTAAIVAGRYALLALLAYVMIARLRLPPLGLLAGASSVVAAVSIEAFRFLLKKTS